jgi:hypothetical protein
VSSEFDGVSSSAARAGRREWMAAEAAAHNDVTGAWLPAAPEGGSHRTADGLRRSGQPADYPRPDG